MDVTGEAPPTSPKQIACSTYVGLQPSLANALHPVSLSSSSHSTLLARRFSQMFRNAKIFNQPISGWDTSKVTDMA